MPYIYIYVAINYLNTDIATFIALIYPLVLIPLMDYSNDKRTGKNILIYHQVTIQVTIYYFCNLFVRKRNVIGANLPTL